MLVLDTADVPAHERRSLVADSLRTATLASHWMPDGPSERVHLTMRTWDFGGLEVVDARCSPHTLRRSQTPRSDEEPVLAMTCGIRGRGVNSQHEHDVSVGPGQVWMTDLTSPHVHQITDTWTVTAKVPLELLGVPERLVRSAMHQVGSSPLAPLFVHHVTELGRVADDMSREAGMSLRTSTIALARAVIASVSDDRSLGRESARDVLLMRVQTFIRHNLGDHDLTPEAIAEAHHISVRLLYTTFAQADLRLEQWIIEQRLQRARDELAGALGRGSTTISEVAYRCGFRNASHFTSRFRAAFGMSPREWELSNRSASRMVQAQVGAISRR